jgi:hypothetical protein
MTEDGSDSRTKRKPYSKPLLERVDLVAEEAVLQPCKTKDSALYGWNAIFGGACQTGMQRCSDFAAS